MSKHRQRRAGKVLRKIKAQGPEERAGRSAAELLRMLAEQDPEGHKARLGRAYGVGPDVTSIDWKPADRAPIVVLDRIEPGVTPDYCTHGQATCIACPEWVWLGIETHELVKTGAVLPLCQPCAVRLIPPDSEKIGEVADRPRADGPHS